MAKLVEALFGIVHHVAEAAAAGAIKEGAKRARRFVRAVDTKLTGVQRLAEGEIEACATCGISKREHDDVDAGHAFVAPTRKRRRKKERNRS